MHRLFEQYSNYRWAAAHEWIGFACNPCQVISGRYIHTNSWKKNKNSWIANYYYYCIDYNIIVLLKLQHDAIYLLSGMKWALHCCGIAIYFADNIVHIQWRTQLFTFGSTIRQCYIKVWEDLAIVIGLLKIAVECISFKTNFFRILMYATMNNELIKWFQWKWAVLEKQKS